MKSSQKLRVKRITTSPQRRSNLYISTTSRNDEQELKETILSGDEDTHSKLYGPYSPQTLRIPITLDGKSGQNSARKQFLFKRAASQQQMVAQFPRQEYSDTPETFLTPINTNREEKSIVYEQQAYSYMPRNTPKYQGIKEDEDGSIQKRQILGSGEIYKQVAAKHKTLLDIKHIMALGKQTTMRQGIMKNKTFNMQDVYTSTRQSQDGQREIMSVKSRTLHNVHLSKMNNPYSHHDNNTALPSNRTKFNDTIESHTTTSPQKTKRHRFIKFPEQNVKETLSTIFERIRNNQEPSTLNFTASGATWASSTSKISTIGGLIKEIQQERNLQKIDQNNKIWDSQATSLNSRILTDKRTKKERHQNILMKQVMDGKCQSVMMRDQAYIEKIQAVSAISHLRDLQHLNTNVGWIFSLRQSVFDNKRKSQQYLPCTNNSNINAVIMPKPTNVPEIFCKQHFDEDDIINQQEEQQDDQKFGTSDFDFTQRTNMDDQTLRMKDLTVSKLSNLNQTLRIQRVKSEPNFKKWEAYQKAWKNEGAEITKVMMGTNLDNIKGLKLKGENVLNKEVQHCMSIPNEQRVYMLNHYFSDEGEGEPQDEEIIALQYDSQYGISEDQSTTLIKSERDKNEYSVFTLPNGLQCLLIQDNNSKELEKGGNLASVSLSVNCGCLNDPMKRQGLAHFLEHMIFMGSEKYPDENAFSNLISSHGGYSNAYTELEFTNYQFRVDEKGLFKALDMFACLLKEPILKQDAQDREIQSIESEFESNYPYDGSRRFQLLCSNTSNKNHLLNRFTWGNLKSLTTQAPKDLLKDLRKFYEEQYSADRMKLVIQMKTSDNLKELKQQVTEIFSQIPNKQLGLQDFSKIAQPNKVLPFDKNLNEIIVFNAVKNSNILFILFTFENTNKKAQSLAIYLLASIIGHEGMGSLYQDLKKQQLILKVEVYEDTQYKTLFTGLKVQFTLTQKGLAEYETVLAGLFRYVQLVKESLKDLESTFEFQFFKEMQIMSRIGFEFYKIPDPLDNVCELANELIFTKNARNILKDTYSDQIVEDIDISYVKTMLDQMTLQNCKIFISGKSILQSDQFTKHIGKKIKVEKWFKTKYAILKKNEKLINSKTNEYNIDKIFLPMKNPFIPDSFSTKSDQNLERNNQPKLIFKNPNQYEIWLHQDHTFKMPRAIVQLQFILDKFFENPRARAYFSVFTDALVEKVTSSIGYEAVLSDISYSIKTFENLGFKIKFTGYNEKIADFMDQFMKIMLKTLQEGFEEWLVNLGVEKVTKSYKNMNVEVDQRAANNRLIYLQHNSFHACQVIPELESFDLKDFNEYYVRSQIIQKIQYFKIFVAGNMNEQDAITIGDTLITNLKLEHFKQQNKDEKKFFTQIRVAREDKIFEWDCIQEQNNNGGGKDDDDDDDDDDEEEEHEMDDGSEGSENESMEDLTGDNPEEQEEDSKDGSDDESQQSKDENPENNSLISIYFQSREHDLVNGVLLELLENVLEEKFYDALRNKEQCGYYVAATRRQTRGVFGFLFTIESAKFDPLNLQEKIFKFITETYDYFSSHTEEIQTFLDGLLARKKEGFKDIKEEAGYYFNQLKDFFPDDNQSVIWDRVDQEIHIIENDITIEKILNKYREQFLDKPRIAIFRVFAQKFKHLAKHLEIEDKFKNGDIADLETFFGETIKMYLSS